MVKIFKCILCIFLLGLISFIFGCSESKAESLKVSPLFSDNMILQQNEPIRIWGTSEREGDTVTAVMGNSIGSCTVTDGQWEIELAARCYSDEALTLEVYDNKGSYESFENIMIGDVWWILGQSNVEFTSSATDEFEEFTKTISGNEKIRTVLIKTDSFKENKIIWRSFSRYSTYDSSAIGTFFIKNISDGVSNEIPLAIINMGFGGREIADFLPRGEIYESVLSHMEKMPIAGIIWYQGESDAEKHISYAKKLKTFLQLLREKKSSIFPVYSVELPPCFNNAGNENWQYADFGLVRGESCGLTAEVSEFYVCPTGDLWRNKEYENNIHPNNKTVIAQRLAVMILSKEYGFGNEEMYFGPLVKNISYDGENRKKVIIEFSYTGEGICGEKEGLELFNDSFMKIRDFTFYISGKNKIILSADVDIAAVRYGTDTDAVFPKDRNLASSYNIPAPAFSYTLSRKTTSESSRHIILTLCFAAVLITILAAAIKKGLK